MFRLRFNDFSTHSKSRMKRIWRTADTFAIPKKWTCEVLVHSISRKLVVKERGPRREARRPPRPRLVTMFARLWVCMAWTSARTSQQRETLEDLDDWSDVRPISCRGVWSKGTSAVGRSSSGRKEGITRRRWTNQQASSRYLVSLKCVYKLRKIFSKLPRII